MIKEFKLNKNNKIEFTESELKSLLDEVYKDGRNSNNQKHFYWLPPFTEGYWRSPYDQIYCCDVDTSAINVANTTVSTKR